LLTSGQHLVAADHLRELRDTAQEALREMRLLIFELRPLALEKGGLATALQVRLDSVETRAGIQASLHVEGKERLPHTIQEELYHIAREALNNVLKHAHAQHVRIQLQFQDDATSLQVSDDGVGFDPQASKGGGLGLPGMKERVQKINGELRIESAPGQGTTVSVRVPTNNRM
jgi:signal transduction histidine kinase